jgi:hypothetical protein
MHSYSSTGLTQKKKTNYQLRLSSKSYCIFIFRWFWIGFFAQKAPIEMEVFSVLHGTC